MEFDLSKENIQPLRGGRNVTQLGVALQAQNDSEIQRELMQQKGVFEETIRTYEGDDPLDNWYNYIHWVEQSYPKHGHEGNLISLLEDCLSNFENDDRYVHDRRLCKLWIKYIDLQQNPLELFQLLYSKGICVSCSDLYRAWAFYHEIAGDYKRADTVFQLGLRALAQPFEELTVAHQNMFMAIGKETIQGVDERRREEERHALTTLVSYKQNQRTMVPSVRTGSNVLFSTPGIIQNTRSERSSNVPVTLYEDLEVAGPSIGACASVSVLEVARKQEVVHKENTLKPGTWKKNIISKKVPQQRQPSFKIHEDEDPAFAGGIRLPSDFAPMNFDDFSDWKTEIFYPEPHDDTKISMYPKLIVYGTPGVEFSPEEIHASKWFEKHQAASFAKHESCMTMQETMMEEPNIVTNNSDHNLIRKEIEQAVQSILPSSETETIHNLPTLQFFPHNISAYEHHNETSDEIESMPEQSALQQPNASVYQSIASDISQHISGQYNVNQAQIVRSSSYNQNQLTQATHLINNSHIYSQQNFHSNILQPWIAQPNAPRKEIIDPIQNLPNNTVITDDNFTENTRAAMKTINEIWKTSLTETHEPIYHQVHKPQISKFQIHEDSVLTDKQKYEAQEKPSSNNLHFTIYDDSENDNKRIPQQNLGPEGNSTMGYRKPVRENIRAPFSSQPLSEIDHELPRKTYSEPLYKENISSEIKKHDQFVTFEDNVPGATANINDSCTTQVFNFNLNSEKASTPFNYKRNAAQQYDNATHFNSREEVLKSNAKKLFDEVKDDVKYAQQEEIREEKLSVILETTKEYRNSSSSGSSSSSNNMLKISTFNRDNLKAIPEISLTRDESVMNEIHNKIQNSSDNQKEFDNSNISDYSMVKALLKSDSPMGNRKSLAVNKSQMEHFIDLTGDSPRKSLHRFSEVGGGDAIQTYQKSTCTNNYESPMKNQFREMTCDSSNDSLSSSPVKGHKMDVDINILHSQIADSEIRMEHEDVDETILQKTSFDPFNSKLTNAFLRKVRFPNSKYSSQFIQMQNLPRLTVKKEVVSFANDKYEIQKVIGKGAFGMVYKSLKVDTGEIVALKHQKPPNKWEYYITKEIKERLLNKHMLNAYIDVTACYISSSSSVLVSEFFKLGSLLDLTNKIKKVTGKCLKELVAIYYASEIITIVHTLHKCNIIHADIKPDNFLVTRMPPEFGYPSLQLIDFGNSIDMSLFPKGTTFKTVVNTENFICTEMKDGKPWTYQTDIFCIAATVHVLLFDKYMEVQKKGSVWVITQYIPRYMRKDLWETFFFQMLNIENCDQLPDLNQIKASFNSIISAQSEELQSEMRLVANNVLGK